MTETVNVDEAKKNISRLLDTVTKDSDEVNIAEGGDPVARILPVARPNRVSRAPGIDEGLFVVPDDFNDPLPKGIEDSFYE
jgi:antitoxin (DNA-binding transcriptional repressor) of toxin-antitoxin stability system